LCYKLPNTQYEAGKTERPLKLSVMNVWSNEWFFKSQISCRVHWALNSDFQSVKFHWWCHLWCHNWWA